MALLWSSANTILWCRHCRINRYAVAPMSQEFLLFLICERKNIWRDSVTRFFASVLFHESSSHRPLKITLASFQIFGENSRRYLLVKVHPQYQRYWQQILPQVLLCHLWQRYQQQILTLAANTGNNINIRRLTPGTWRKNFSICLLYSQRCPN